MLGATHSHAPRVVTLLEAARDQIANDDFKGFGLQAIALELRVRSGRDRNRSDATNYLGGIADVLEDEAHRGGALGHLGELAQVSLYNNDRQVEEVHYYWEDAVSPSYRVRFWSLD